MRHCKTFNDVYTVVFKLHRQTRLLAISHFLPNPIYQNPKLRSETKCNQRGWQNRQNYPGAKRQKQAKGTKTKGVPNAKQLKTMAAAALK